MFFCFIFVAVVVATARVIGFVEIIIHCVHLVANWTKSGKKPARGGGGGGYTEQDAETYS